MYTNWAALIEFNELLKIRWHEGKRGLRLWDLKKKRRGVGIDINKIHCIYV